MHNKIVLYLIIICLLPASCSFVGTPINSDHWKLISTAQYRMESGRAVGARNVFKKALSEAEKENDLYALAVIHNDLGLCYIRENKNTLEAEKHYKIAKEISETHGYKYELAYNFLNYAQLWHILDISDNSCVAIKQALSLLRELLIKPVMPPYGEGFSKVKKLVDKTIKYAKEIGCDDSQLVKMR